MPKSSLVKLLPWVAMVETGYAALFLGAKVTSPCESVLMGIEELPRHKERPVATRAAVLVFILLLTACSSAEDSAPKPCGNGLIDQGEVCDGVSLDNQTCVSLGLGAGQLSCSSACDGFDLRQCGASAACGNGQIDAPEICDGSQLNNATCASLGQGQGKLGCVANCAAYDTSGCSGSTCTKNCSGRVCGPDPVCGESCGTCSSGSCDASGQCVGASADGPVILELRTNTSSITESEARMLTISAMVTDPDGIDDVIGGSLVDPTSEGSYGAFVTSAQEGSYSLTLSWWQLNAVKAITAVGPAGTQRTLRAKFYDVAGHVATRDVTVTLKCSNAALTACDGSCVDLATDLQNCGQCGNQLSYNHAECKAGQAACTDTDIYCEGVCLPVNDNSEGTSFGDPVADRNCGQCGHKCSDVAASVGGVSQGCSNGHCFVELTSTSQTSCNTTCAALSFECFAQDSSAYVATATYVSSSNSCTRTLGGQCRDAYSTITNFDGCFDARFQSVVCPCME